MAYTKEEWEWLKDHLTIGCTFRLYRGAGSIGLAVVEKQPCGLRANFTYNDPNWRSNWDFLDYLPTRLHDLVDCCWPDGSPMIPFVEHDGKPYNPVIAKVRSLQSRFQNKTLRKTTHVQSLSLP